MKEKTFEIQGREVFISSKELNEIYRYCFREVIKDTIRYLHGENFNTTKELSEDIVNNIADTIETKEEDYAPRIQWIEEELEEYREEIEEEEN